MNTCVEVPNGSSSTSETAQLETTDGSLSGTISYPAPGVTIAPSNNEQGVTAGYAGATSIVRNTDGAGPYHRRGYMNIVSAKVECLLGYGGGYAEICVDFGLPN